MATNKRTKNASSKQKKINNTQPQAQKSEEKAADAIKLVKEESKATKTTGKIEKKPQKKTSVKSKKPNIFQQIVDFIKAVYHELRKVTWLTKKELVQKTGVVAGIVTIFTLLVWVVDSGLGALAALFLR